MKKEQTPKEWQSPDRAQETAVVSDSTGYIKELEAEYSIVIDSLPEAPHHFKILFKNGWQYHLKPLTFRELHSVIARPDETEIFFFAIRDKLIPDGGEAPVITEAWCEKNEVDAIRISQIIRRLLYQSRLSAGGVL